MKMVKCDICGSDIKEDENMASVDMYPFDDGEKYLRLIFFNIDLCSKCSDLLQSSMFKVLDGE